MVVSLGLLLEDLPQALNWLLSYNIKNMCCTHPISQFYKWGVGVVCLNNPYIFD